MDDEKHLEKEFRCGIPAPDVTQLMQEDHPAFLGRPIPGAAREIDGLPENTGDEGRQIVRQPTQAGSVAQAELVGACAGDLENARIVQWQGKGFPAELPDPEGAANESESEQGGCSKPGGSQRLDWPGGSACFDEGLCVESG